MRRSSFQPPPVTPVPLFHYQFYQGQSIGGGSAVLPTRVFCVGCLGLIGGNRRASVWYPPPPAPPLPIRDYLRPHLPGVPLTTRLLEVNHFRVRNQYNPFALPFEFLPKQSISLLPMPNVPFTPSERVTKDEVTAVADGSDNMKGGDPSDIKKAFKEMVKQKAGNEDERFSDNQEDEESSVKKSLKKRNGSQEVRRYCSRNLILPILGSYGIPRLIKETPVNEQAKSSVSTVNRGSSSEQGLGLIVKHERPETEEGVSSQKHMKKTLLEIGKPIQTLQEKQAQDVTDSKNASASIQNCRSGFPEPLLSKSVIVKQEPEYDVAQNLTKTRNKALEIGKLEKQLDVALQPSPLAANLAVGACQHSQVINSAALTQKDPSSTMAVSNNQNDLEIVRLLSSNEIRSMSSAIDLSEAWNVLQGFSPSAIAKTAFGTPLISTIPRTENTLNDNILLLATALTEEEGQTVLLVLRTHAIFNATEAKRIKKIIPILQRHTTMISKIAEKPRPQFERFVRILRVVGCVKLADAIDENLGKK